MPYTAGIDLGTTFTAAAVCRRGEGRAEVVSLGDRAASIPSVVLVRDDSTILTGDAASRRAVLEPDRVAREFKRRLGDPTPLLLGGAPHSAESLQAKLLRSVHDAIVQSEGGPPESVAVTFPANWGRYKQELLAQTLRIAGLDEARAFTEPAAAAMHYASNERVEPGEIVAVYDLGGGTFDAAILKKTDDDFEILGTPEGLEHLGGVDFDHSVLQHVNAAIGGALDRLDLDNPSDRADLARLRADCAEAKEALSTDTEVTIPVSIEGRRTEVRLTRAELDEMVGPAIAETIDAMRRAIASAGVSIDDVSRILLVGGASRMPIVSRMVASELGRPVFLDAHPKHAIALGAALIAERAAAAAAGADTSPAAPHLQDFAIAEAATAVAAVAANEDLPPPPASSKRSRALLTLPKRNPVSLALLVTLIVAIVGYTFFLRPQAEASGVLYQDPTTRGPSPFTEPAVDKELASEATASPSSDNETPRGPFGGSGILTKCNKSMLVKFLNKNPDRKREWARVLGIETKDFEQYVGTLRSATVRVDTRVTNHGFKNGRAFELQSILAKGTAVLVDPSGKIVTRCYCGNPLTEPKPQGTSTCTDCPRGYAPPPECKGSDCYELAKNTQATEDVVDESRSPTGGGGGRPSTRSESTGNTPTVRTFISGQTTPEPDDDTPTQENQPSSGLVQPSDNDDTGGGYIGPAITPKPTPKSPGCNPC